MVITNYRVQSVLRTYTRQLERSQLSAKPGRATGGGDSSAEKVSISGDGKFRLMMDRVTSQVLEKMYPKQDDNIGPAGKESVVADGPVTEGNT
ncbi:MAG: DVU0524 family FlgM-associated protein [Limisphaerales bacterium]